MSAITDLASALGITQTVQQTETTAERYGTIAYLVIVVLLVIDTFLLVRLARRGR